MSRRLPISVRKGRYQAWDEIPDGPGRKLRGRIFGPDIEVWGGWRREGVEFPETVEKIGDGRVGTCTAISSR